MYPIPYWFLAEEVSEVSRYRDLIKAYGCEKDLSEMSLEQLQIHLYDHQFPEGGDDDD